MQNWPPPYTIHISNRAKHVGLKICPNKGLQIVTPKRFSQKHIPEVLEKHRAWIEKTWQRVQPDLTSFIERELPTQIDLQAINETWQVEYRFSTEKTIKIYHGNSQQLIISGNTENKKLVRHGLKKWLLKYAQLTLLPKLEYYSKQTNLSFARSGIRHASSLWGSCSAQKNISLNCRLLFLPSALMEYVILHELCHTVHLNHSKHFWNLLKQFNSDCLQRRKELRNSNQYLPKWLV